MSEKALNQPISPRMVEGFGETARNGAVKNELRNSRIIGHSGSNRWHNLIVSNISVGIGSRLHGRKDEIYISNMKVRLKNGLICYPDVVIVHGEPVFADSHLEILTNPTVIVDIFSTESDSLEKTKKLESFLEMESVKECLLIKQDEMRVEHFAKQNQKQWVYRIYNEREDVVSLEAAGCKISLQEIYSQVNARSTEITSRAVN